METAFAVLNPTGEASALVELPFETYVAEDTLEVGLVFLTEDPKTALAPLQLGAYANPEAGKGEVCPACSCGGSASGVGCGEKQMGIVSHTGKRLGVNKAGNKCPLLGHISTRDPIAAEGCEVLKSEPECWLDPVPNYRGSD